MRIPLQYHWTAPGSRCQVCLERREEEDEGKEEKGVCRTSRPGPGEGAAVPLPPIKSLWYLFPVPSSLHPPAHGALGLVLWEFWDKWLSRMMSAVVEVFSPLTLSGVC